jgi:hypothetical protein
MSFCAVPLRRCTAGALLMMLAVVTTRPAMAQAPDIITTSGVGTSVDPVRATLDVTVGSASPDCVPEKVILINGRFQPMLRLTQGDWVEVRLLPHVAEQQPALLGAGGAIADSRATTQRTCLCRVAADHCAQQHPRGLAQHKQWHIDTLAWL